MSEKTPSSPRRTETQLTHTGRVPFDHFGFVNTPPMRGSTVLFPDLETLQSKSQRYGYGRTGNPSTDAVQDIVTQLEGAAGTVCAPSGLSAISTAILSVMSSGGDILITDSAYDPTRNFCNNVLTRMGVSVRYYDPRIGAGIADLIQDNTQAIFTESPGSLTFEIQDLPAIVQAAKAGGAAVLVDNSWATPLYYKPLELGADIVIHAGTKMFVGHSDAMVGTISANEKYFPQIAQTHRAMGTCLAPDEAFLAARGLRTLSIRMKEHEARALELARWLEAEQGVTRVIHPALPSHPDHAIFKRDFSGSGSLFSIILPPAPNERLAAMLDNMELFSMGYSWGGYESLIIPASPGRIRTVVPWQDEGQVVRLHIGFEDINDLKADLAAGLKRYHAG